MIFFPNCKINIGLEILFRRADGFHDISTVMYPVYGLCDALEMLHSSSGFTFTSSGLELGCHPEHNICYKAYSLMSERFGIGGVRLHLHKAIPFGAGLGGGSADGACTIKGLNELFELHLTENEMEDLAGEIGSDTSFFIRNRPQLACGRGNILTPVTLSLSGKTLVIVKPPVAISTAEAYSGVIPAIPSTPLEERISHDISQWKDQISNAFEKHIFSQYPLLGKIKNELYSLGALYASMSGSGSSIYGIFEEAPENISSYFKGMFTYQEVMK